MWSGASRAWSAATRTSPEPSPVRPGRHARVRGRGLGPHAARRASAGVRQRRHDRTGRAGLARCDLPETHGREVADADAWISGLRSSERLVEDIWA